MVEAHWHDLLFPAFAFLMVIVAPTCVAAWVIFKTIFEDEKEATER